MKLPRTAFTLVSAVLLGACAARSPAPPATPAALPAAVSATLQGDAAHPARTHGWLRTELYFGTGPADDPARGVSEAQWRAFLDAEITPRFPAGLSVLDLYGQWQDQGAPRPERLRSKLIVLLHENTPQADASLDAIRAAWKARTGDQSVLRVSQPADVSF